MRQTISSRSNKAQSTVNLDQKAHHALEIDNLVIVFQVRRGDGCCQKAVAIFQRGQAAIDQFRGLEKENRAQDHNSKQRLQHCRHSKHNGNSNLLDEVSSVPEKSGSSVSCDTPSAGRVRNLQQGQPGPEAAGVPHRGTNTTRTANNHSINTQALLTAAVPQENKSHRPQPSIAVCCVNADHLEQFGPAIMMNACIVL